MRSALSVRRERRAVRPALQVESLEPRLAPSFVAPLAYDAGSNPFSVAVADLNGDGWPDLVVTANSGVSVLLNDGIWSGSGPGPAGAPGGRRAPRRAPERFSATAVPLRPETVAPLLTRRVATSTPTPPAADPSANLGGEQPRLAAAAPARPHAVSAPLLDRLFEELAAAPAWDCFPMGLGG